MKSKVWVSPTADGEAVESVAGKAGRLVEAAGLSDIVREGALVAILQHFGEGDGIGFVKPPVTRALVERLLNLGAKPFLTGTSTLYRGRRSNARDHMVQAYDHGFTPADVYCPVIMSDGLRGADRIEVAVPGAKHCPTAYVGSGVGVFDGMLAVTHPTGHPGAGFGAAMKNVSMGLASRGGKMAMHHNSCPVFLPKKCTACGRCAEWCPEDAISIGKTAELNKERCIGCGQCLAVCPCDAIDFHWGVSGLDFQERMVEYCLAVHALLKGRILYLNVVQHYQKSCDCNDFPQDAVCPDIGLLVSSDLVAVDTATADLLKEKAGKDVVLEAGGRDYRQMLAYAEQMGLGSRDYGLVSV